MGNGLIMVTVGSLERMQPVYSQSLVEMNTDILLKFEQYKASQPFLGLLDRNEKPTE
jgi:hypothetical protein